MVVISHDFSGLEDLCPRILHLEDGVLAPAPTAAGGCHDRADQAATQARRAAAPVPGRSVIHDLWAGTKLIVVAGIGVLLTFYPGWVPIGLVAALVLTAAWLARIPAAARCRRYRAGCGSC